jgi:heat shock protein HspQ
MRAFLRIRVLGFKRIVLFDIDNKFSLCKENSRESNSIAEGQRNRDSDQFAG